MGCLQGLRKGSTLLLLLPMQLYHNQYMENQRGGQKRKAIRTNHAGAVKIFIWAYCPYLNNDIATQSSNSQERSRIIATKVLPRNIKQENSMSNNLDLTAINSELREQTPQKVIEWALKQGQRPIVTTNFGPHEAAILHMVVQLSPDLPVICVDHGYNTNATYRFADEVTRRLSLNMQYFTPKVTAKRREIIYGGFPSIDDEAAHDEFTREVKLEPFARAMKEFQPDVWLTAIRKEQTPFRDSLDIVTQDISTGVIKVAPLFYWTELDLEEYLVEHDLPIEEDYFDPTKVLKDRECGLHVGKA